MVALVGFSAPRKNAVAGEILKGKKVISKGLAKSRLIYNNSHHHTLLNFAAYQFKSKTLGRMNNCVEVKVQFNGEAENATIWVKVNSLAKRLGVKKSEILKKSKTNDFEDYLNKKIKEKASIIDNEFLKGAPMKSIGKQPIDSWLQRYRAQISDFAWMLITKSVKFASLRSLSKTKSKTLTQLSEARATRMYRTAAKKVPAYRAFLKKHCSKKPKTFDQVPISNKKNYIQEAGSIVETLIDGKLPKQAQIDSSTGTTGKPSTWVRGKDEREFNKKQVDFLRKELIGDAFFINAYILGTFSTGITSHTTLVDQTQVASTGPNASRVIDMIEDFGKDMKKIVVTSYPSFMPLVLAEAKKRGVDLRDYHISAVVGGEPISEVSRAALIEGGFKKVISGYGASDLDINIGFETDFSVTLRQECEKNPALAREIFGKKKGSPMIFHYNPLFYYIETNKDGHLLFTSLGGKKASPRIRYDVLDVGKTMTTDELKKKLKKFDIDLPSPSLPLPLLFVWGREGSSVKYKSTNMTPEEFEKAFSTIDELKDKVKHYALHSYEKEGNSRVDFWIELTEDASGLNTEENQKKWGNIILDYFRENNLDFNRMEELGSADLPKLFLFEHGSSRMANEPPQAKAKHIYID